jgi:hypothetical protein
MHACSREPGQCWTCWAHLSSGWMTDAAGYLGRGGGGLLDTSSIRSATSGSSCCFGRMDCRHHRSTQPQQGQAAAPGPGLSLRESPEATLVMRMCMQVAAGCPTCTMHKQLPAHTAANKTACEHCWLKAEPACPQPLWSQLLPSSNPHTAVHQSIAPWPLIASSHKKT